ncbi:uncharacterized protein LOC120286124 isoform X1 [Eucalyptus grandis]|uniref:uncharacterized protein LOC120286124 isoform X1 n=1 Tax=Eucalyptus grandis TaxID=71139 RepID=UPI00192F1038|nr:uncharacterized protein LOC120286124 isoform X1 [Eucalyptus grandis]XP_039164910.1 uncharacterized protein LOC120286124 isoform X1 [Eucalyptus grandis]XP_039164911.1 uncharacterized protein LOC120286124 isoform X1 [Eucalyptus grandis]
MEEHDSEKWQLRSQAAFEKFDIDRDGYITPEELRLQTGLKGSVGPLLEEADVVNKDGKISLSEFRRLLRTASMGSQNLPSPSGYWNLRSILELLGVKKRGGSTRQVTYFGYSRYTEPTMMTASVLRSIANGNPCTKVSIEGFCMAPQVSREVLEDEGLERLLAVVVYLVRGKGYTGVRLLMSVGCVGC